MGTFEYRLRSHIPNARKPILTMNITIGLVDDHQLFLKSLSMMLNSFNNFSVVLEACNGKDLQEKIQANNTLPDILLIDVNMPIMNGIDTANWVTTHYPSIKCAALSVNDSDLTILAMIRAGCCAYLLKDMHPDELEIALLSIKQTGFYDRDASSRNVVKLLHSNASNNEFKLSEKELIFLRYSCTELTYKQIAIKMDLSERTIDQYRENLFKKLHVQSRIGLALEAVKRELIKL